MNSSVLLPQIAVVRVQRFRALLFKDKTSKILQKWRHTTSAIFKKIELRRSMLFLGISYISQRCEKNIELGPTISRDKRSKTFHTIASILKKNLNGSKRKSQSLLSTTVSYLRSLIESGPHIFPWKVNKITYARIEIDNIFIHFIL